MAKPVRRRDEAVGGAGLFARLRRGIVHMLLGDGASPPPPELDPEGLRSRRRLSNRQRADELHLVEEIRHLLGTNAAPLVGRLNLIGLAKIKERFGAEWPRVARRADRIARNIIERHIAPGDVYAGWGEDNYIMVFARLGEAEARVKCVLIAKEITTSLLGEDSKETLEIRTAVSRLDGAIDFAAVTSLDQLFDGDKPIDPAPPDPVVELALEERELEAEAMPDPFTPSPFTAPPFADVPPAPAEITFIPIEHRRKKVTFRPGMHGNVLAGMDFMFRPIWDPRLHVIATYYCVPQVRLSDAGGVAGDAEMAVAGDPDATARLDAAAIERVKQEFAFMETAGRRLVLVAPLHFETLSSMSQRRRVAATIAQVAANGRKNSLMVEIVGVPVGIQKARVMDIIAPLRPHCRGVALQMPLESLDFSQLAGAGVAAVGMDLSYVSKAEVIQMQQLSRFQKAAEKVQVATFVHGARSLSMVAAALGAGFHFIDGDAVLPNVPHADRALEFQLADLYHAR